jgi:uncharacterized protein YprB with RNaseH-like and TPR domain
VETPLKPPPAFCAALAFLVRDLEYYPSGEELLPGDLLFFDLETTGLSQGAGTLAFLAALGRFQGDSLLVEQYLLLDYPGETDFLERIITRFAPRGVEKPPLLVTYNGKAFDSQILKTRCLMNGMVPPAYFHADLLHPARKLWKRRLPNWSQAVIETLVLGLDRQGDMPGSMAPEAWFSFLRTGDAGPLLGICDHNLRDIVGLASLFMAFQKICAGPFESRRIFRFDFEALALLWRRALRREGPGFPRSPGEDPAALGRELLEAAAGEYPRAALARAFDFMAGGKHEKGRKALGEIASGAFDSASSRVRAAASRGLAVDAEWRLRDLSLALDYTETALALGDLPPAFREELLRRRERIKRKQEASGSGPGGDGPKEGLGF